MAELGATQAETLALRERLAGQEAAIGRLLATRKAMLATARAEVRALVRVDPMRPSGYAGATRPRRTRA